jgi:serine protease Do
MKLLQLPKIKLSKKLPNFKMPKFLTGQRKNNAVQEKKNFRHTLILIIFISSICGFWAGAFSATYFYLEIKDWLNSFDFNLPLSVYDKGNQEIPEKYISNIPQEQAVIKVVEEFSPAVVSIIVSKDLPVYEEYYSDPFENFFDPFNDFQFKIPQYRQKGTEKKQVGGGTGFIISEDGMILTNKHVVLEEDVEYTVLTNQGLSFPAKILAKDPLQDLAILKIEQEQGIGEQGEFVSEKFSVVKFGDSDNLQIGQTVITIGNALGEFQNTVSVGIVSGLGRTINASGGSFYETLEDVIQTDAAINKGNSGGPLLNLKGEVIGINTAMSVEGENIGFAIPINKAKRDIEQIKTLGEIVYPFLGIRYQLVNPEIKKERDLSVDYGALIVGGEGEPAITSGSAAEKAGLKEGDIVLEFDNQKINLKNSLAKIIMGYSPEDKIVLKILRGEEEINIEVVLG